MVLAATMRELSDKDREFLMAMLKDEDVSSIGTIGSRLKASPSLTNKYKNRLLDQGVIAEAGFGKVIIDMPGLRDYLNRM
jgi:DNA-binding Lrp family transcriptional regulator